MEGAMADPVLRGSQAIARALGVSKRTVLRMAKDKRIPAFKAGEHTSPLQIKREDLDLLPRKRKRKGD
ncbi:MAG: helix-turn-helix domain-containing protein [Salinarimonadaceae bacterium]|nr:MAG: helix-turn-helix domain-containing protein [Salinarimonadaceae bacterium]